MIGSGGDNLLNAIHAAEAPVWPRKIPAVQTLRPVWVQQFFWDEGELRWRDASNVLPAGQSIDPPADPEAHYTHQHLALLW